MKFEIVGEPLPVVICYPQPGEALVTERGSMSWMSPNMNMETSTNGGIGKALGRLFTGESFFQNKNTALGEEGLIAFASRFPGSIKVFHITPDNPMIVQKTAFLASEVGVDVAIHFQKKMGAGFFGGEGFIMQRLSGYGTAFVEIDGYAKEYTLEANQSMIVDTGYLAAMSATCSMDVKTVPGMKNILFGGEGLFNTVVTGPGTVILQSMPVSNVATLMSTFMGSSNK